jgi:hypothetical protein
MEAELVAVPSDSDRVKICKCEADRIKIGTHGARLSNSTAVLLTQRLLAGWSAKRKLYQPRPPNCT